MHRWLNEPGVVEWWEGDDVSWEAVVLGYGAASEPWLEHWLALLDGEPFGWAQCYPAAESPEEIEHWFPLGVDEAAAGIDYLVGAPQNRGRGLGSAMLARFVDDVVFARHPAWTEACASPLEANVASWRALEKAGFSFVGTFDDVMGPCRLMRRRRTDPTGSTSSGR
jgi:aminoglycoside 6'-N-acetyltransferase